MKLRIVERKKINLKESNGSSTIRVSMHPKDFLKLTVDDESYNQIEEFINKKLMNLAINKEKLKDRKQFIEERISGTSPTAMNILLRAINFASPASDARGSGSYEEKEAGITSLAVSISGGVGKVTNHGGRARNTFQWLTSKNTVPVDIYFENANITDIKQIPEIVSQFSDSTSITTSDIKSLSGSGESYPDVATFISKIGKYTLRDKLSKFREENIIKVGSEEAYLGKVNVGAFETCLYKMSYKNVDASLVDSDNAEYWKQMKSHLFGSSDGPVTVSKK